MDKYNYYHIDMRTNFSDLPFEVYYNIGLTLSYKDVLSQSSTSKKFAELCNNSLFWKLKSIHDFGISTVDYDLLLDKTGNDRETYLYLAGIKNLPIDGAERYGNIRILIKNAIKARDYELFWKFFKLHPCGELFFEVGCVDPTSNDINRLKELIDMAIKTYSRTKGSIIKHALCGAALAGNMELISYLINLEAVDYVGMLECAAQGGNISVVQLVLERYEKILSMDYAMATAAKFGKLNIVNYLLEQGYTNYNIGLQNAAETANREIMDMMITLGATNFCTALYHAASGGHYDIVMEMVNKITRVYDVNSAMINAARSGNIPLTDYFISNGADMFRGAIVTAAQQGDLDMINFLVMRGNLMNSETITTRTLLTAVRFGHLKVLKHFFSYAPSEYYNDYLLEAAKYGYLDIVEFLINNGANDIEGAMHISILQPNIQHYLKSLSQ